MKNKHNHFTHDYTPSNKKKKEEMEKAVKIIHKFMVYDIVKKFHYLLENRTEL